jgi:radical SAM protein with 4Fe4S-binding SPASM domain
MVENTIRKHIPMNVIFELTYRCNLRCKHCYIPEPNRHLSELSTEEIEDALQQLADLKTLYLTLTGGEIFLRPDIFRIGNRAKALGFALKFFTNGTLITPRIADKIAELRPFTVEISIYGINATTHDFVTKAKGSHAKSMEAVRMLAQRGIRTKAKMPLMNHSFQEYHELLDECESLGVECRMDHSIVAMDDGDRDPLKLRTTDEQLFQIFMDKKISPKGDLPTAPAQLCEAGRNTLSISPNGDVVPCIQLPLVAGNIRQQSLRDIWEGSPVMLRTRNWTTDDLSDCPTCSLQKHCNRCAGMALVEDGDEMGCSSRARQVARVREQIALHRSNGTLHLLPMTKDRQAAPA